VEKTINMRRCLTFFQLLFILSLTACDGSIPDAYTIIDTTITPNLSALPTLTPFGLADNITTNTTPEPEITETGSPSSLSTQNPALVFTPSIYKINANFDYANHYLSVDETIFYQNATGVPLNNLVLAVEPNLWKKCFVLEYLSADDRSAGALVINGDRLDVPLETPLLPGGKLNLKMHFDLLLPEADIHQIFGYNSRQTNLVDWYPFIVPYSNGWLLHAPAEVGEHLVYDTATFDVTLTLSGETVQVTLAAGVPGEVNGSTWHYFLENARRFVLSASPEYQAISIKIDGMRVTSYYFTREETQANAVLDETVKALSTFSALFGPYPYMSLSIVESMYYDGVESDGIFFLSRDFYTSSNGTVLNNLTDIAVHETSHQWWFGSVGNDQALAPWLDESLATYSELLFYNINYPAVTAWWAFRVEAYTPTGWVGTDIYHGMDFRTYANAVYLRGAQFLGAVRERIGDDEFFSFLRDYAGQMAGKLATPVDFFHILEEHTNKDISDIISDYFQNPY
jgi:hypothetical protein